MTKGIRASSPVMLTLFLDFTGSEIVTYVLLSQKGCEKEQVLVVTAPQVAFRVIIKT